MISGSNINQFQKENNLVDFPKIIHQYCAQKHKNNCDLTLNSIFINIQFRQALYPKAKEVLTHLKTLGKVVLFTEGDSVYQKRKAQESGLAVLADDFLLYPYKLEKLEELVKRYSGYKIIVIEDKSDNLVKIKEQFPQIFTVEVYQGHYSTVDHKKHQGLDIMVPSISSLLSFNRDRLF